MFGVLKRIFSRQGPATDLSDEEFRPDIPKNPNFVTDPENILKLLQDINQNTPLCTITFDNTTEQFTSTILEIHAQKKQIIFDELTPAHGNHILIESNSLKLSTLLKGIHLAFNLQQVTAGSARGIAYYKAGFPERVYYPQKRLTLRIKTQSANIPFQGMSTRTQLSVGGYLFDLSRGGIGIVIPNNRARIQRGEKLSNCRFTLPDGYVVAFDLIIRFTRPGSQNNPKTKLGGYFGNLSSRDRNKLEHYVTVLERESIRKQKA